MDMSIDSILTDWPRLPGEVQTRLVIANDGREVIQIRIDLGVMQLEIKDRPDGERPHGFANYFEYLKDLAASSTEFVMAPEHCMEADREFVQYYHRRVCWLALRQFDRAAADADHTLHFMDFLAEHSPNAEYTAAHEQYRAFVLFHRTQALAAAAVEMNQPEEAIDAIRAGRVRIRSFFTEHELEDRVSDDGMLIALERMEQSLRQTHGIEATLREQLELAVAQEDYEGAAKLRDALKRKP